MTDIARGDRRPSSPGTASNQIADLLEGSIEIITKYRCRYHPGKRATAICESCKADICSDCLHVRSHRLICSGCMGGLDRALAGTGVASPLVRSLTHPFVIALLIVGMLGIFVARLASHERMGLLGKTPATMADAEKHLRLKLVLFSRKGNRIETRGDELIKMARHEEAEQEFRRAKAVYESLVDQTEDKWEQALLMLARAKLLEKLGEDEYAKGLYESVARVADQGRTYPAIAACRLARLQEKTDPETALKTYGKVLDRIKLIPANVRSAMNLAVKAERPYDYESRMYWYTGNSVNFNDIEAETNLRMGLIFMKKGQDYAAEYRFSLAAGMAADPEIGERASKEIYNINALKRAKGQVDEPPEEAEKKEKVVITHF